MSRDVLTFLQIGDLHITSLDQQNYRDFQTIVEEIRRHLSDALDFVFLPGDVANFGKESEYALVRKHLKRVPVPVHVISGDHDMNEGKLSAFYRKLRVRKLPYAETVRGFRCIFLDMCGHGEGQLDFKLGPGQIAWLQCELDATKQARLPCAVFMHTYPEDLADPLERAQVVRVLEAPHVLYVGIGHTHYSELTNDGRKIFAATRSIGQIEEGPAGYSVTVIDGRVVSWRFRRLVDDKPLVMITTPADRRLATDPSDPDHAPSGRCKVRATVLAPRKLESVKCSVDGGPEQEMTRTETPHRFVLSVEIDGARFITVQARDGVSLPGSETIQLARPDDFTRFRHADGSDADRIPRWIDRGIPGRQLGPNRNGKAW